jgi:uncharacterized HAD superfamily protein
MPSAIDIDNTIADTEGLILKRLNARFGTSYSRSQLTSWHVEKALDLNQEQTRFVAALLQDESFWRALKPLPQAAEGVEILSSQDEIVYLTARPKAIADVTVQWLDHFNFPVGEMILGAADKAAYVREFHCDAFVEDDPKQALRVAELPNVAVYMIAHRWNDTVNHPSITRVRGWRDLIQLALGDESEGYW